MVLKTFSCEADDTRLIQYKDTVYKIKLCYRNIVHSLPEKELHAEIEEVLRAVLHSLVSNKALVKIRTEHFHVILSAVFWKTGAMLEFRRNGKLLKGHRDVIILTFIPSSQGQGMSTTGSPSGVRMQEAPSKARQSEENMTQNHGKLAQEPGTAGRSETAHKDGSSRSGSSEIRPTRFAATSNRSATDTSKTGQPSSQEADTRDTTVTSQPPSQPSTRHSQADGELPISSPHPTAVAVRTGEGRNQQALAPDKPSPRPGLRSSHQSKSLQPFAAVELKQISNVRYTYSLRTKTHPDVTHTRPIARSPSKSPRHSLQKPHRNSSGAQKSPRKTAGCASESARTGSQTVVSSAAISRDKAVQGQGGSDRAPNTHITERRGEHVQRHPDQSPALPLVSPIGRRTRQQLVFLQSERASSRATDNPRGPAPRSPPRSTAMFRPRLTEHGLNQLLQNGQTNSQSTSRRTVELHQAVSRGTTAEEQRLRNLAADQDQRGQPPRTRAHWYEQKDRHVIESEERQEELKLQMLASGEACVDSSKKTGRKRGSSLMDLLQDSVVTPIKRALRSAKATA